MGVCFRLSNFHPYSPHPYSFHPYSKFFRVQTIVSVHIYNHKNMVSLYHDCGFKSFYWMNIDDGKQKKASYFFVRGYRFLLLSKLLQRAIKFFLRYCDITHRIVCLLTVSQDISQECYDNRVGRYALRYKV